MEYIIGSLITISDGALIIETHGFGYRIRVTGKTVRFFFDKDGQVKIWLRVIRSETSETMYGFQNEADRELFDMVMEVPGVGPSTSLALMDAMELEDIVSAVRNNDEAAFKAVKGVGAKTAKQIIVSLETKVKLLPGSLTSEAKTTARSALQALGYKARAIDDALATIPKGVDDAQEAIKIALAALK